MEDGFNENEIKIQGTKKEIQMLKCRSYHNFPKAKIFMIVLFLLLS